MLRLRRAPDGSLWIPRPDAETERAMDAQYVRVAGELRWIPIEKGDRVELDQISDRFKGRRAIVLGKGPSLERFGEIEITDADVIAAVNEAALFNRAPRVDLALAVDAPVLARMMNSTRPGTLFVAPAGMQDFGGTACRALGPGIFGPDLRPNMGCSPALLRLLRIAGCSSLILIGFDAFDKPTIGKVYAPSILHLGIPDRDSGDFAPINELLAVEVATWPPESVTFWHRLPKPKVKKGG